MNVVFAPNYKFFNTGDIGTAARELREKIDKTFRNHEKNGDLILLGHSLGGLEIIEAIEGISERIRTVITCATAYQGTPQAKLAAFFSQAARQISPGASYLTSINEKHVSCPVEVHISTEDSVVPPESQIPPSALSDRVVVQSHPFQHFDFIVGKKSTEFARAVKERIRL